jgi:hypothetical protein
MSEFIITPNGRNAKRKHVIRKEISNIPAEQLQNVNQNVSY